MALNVAVAAVFNAKFTAVVLMLKTSMMLDCELNSENCKTAKIMC